MGGFKTTFNHAELPSFIILSLVLQILLIFWAHQRKRISSRPIQRILWLGAFLAADFIATLSLGGIFHMNVNPKSTENKYLLALWAPLILLHLSKHSQITTFSLAENEFWLSHLIRFIYHELIALCTCILASTETRIQSTSIILFIPGTIKLGERVLALKRGSMNELRISTFKKADPGLNDHDLFEFAGISSTANRCGKLDSPINIPADPNADQPYVASTKDETRFLCAAYQSFNKYKGIYIDPIFVYGEMGKQGRAFREIDIDDSFNLMEVELNFAYDLFYTKSACLHTVLGWITRFISLISIFSGLILFSRVDKIGFSTPDVSITYILLIVSLILEVVSLFESMVSNRTIVQVGCWYGNKWRHVENIIHLLSNVTREIKIKYFPRKPTLVGQFSLLRFCFKEAKTMSWLKRVLNFFELKELWNNYNYSSFVPNDEINLLKDHIFHVVRRRLQEEHRQIDGNTANISLVSSRVSSQMPENIIFQENIQREFEQCLIVWHIATDLCFRHAEHFGSFTDQIHLQYAKYISDYMLYLLATQPTMLSPLTTELTSYRNACAASIQFYDDYRINYDGIEVYRVLESKYEIFDKIPREKKHNTLLWDGFKLACELRELETNGNEQIWGLVFEVWVDMLSFAAIRTAGKFHADRLGTGGEFITRVWLFMVHSVMGSRYHF